MPPKSLSFRTNVTNSGPVNVIRAPIDPCSWARVKMRLIDDVWFRYCEICPYFGLNLYPIQFFAHFCPKLFNSFSIAVFPTLPNCSSLCSLPLKHVTLLSTMCLAAISLEWDKQPHYLEASLMMKGYSAEEARAAAARAQRPQAAPRPPLVATAYASTRDKVRISLILRHALNVFKTFCHICLVHSNE